MIEAIRNIGEYALKDNITLDTFLKGICEKVKETVQNKKGDIIKQHVVFLNFDTKSKKIEVEFEQVNAGGKDSGKEYLWLGNNPGAKEQIFLTTNNPIYILTNTLSNLKKRTGPGEFKFVLERILDGFYTDEYVVDPSKFDLINQKTIDITKSLHSIEKSLIYIKTKEEIIEKIIKLKGICSKIEVKFDISSRGNINELKEQAMSKCKELMKLNIKERLVKKYKEDIIKRSKSQTNKRESLLTNDLLDEKFISRNEVSIFTIKLDGELLCNSEEYKKIIFDEKINNLFNINHKNYKSNLKSKGICSICEKNNILTTSNATNLKFKFYMTDKIGFSSNLDGQFTKNYNICKECYQYLMVGENFINSNLSVPIGSLNAYIIPHFIFKLDSLDIEEFSKYIKYSTNSIANLNSISIFQDKLLKYRDYELKKNDFIINYLFYYNPAGSSEFKILKLIKDIPPRRLDLIKRVEEEISNLSNEYYEENTYLKVDLNQIWESIPIKKGEKSSYYSGYSRYLNIIDAIFSDKRIDYNFLINQFIETIRIIKFKREGYNIRIKQDFIDKILILNFLLLFFNKLKLLGGINMMNKNCETSLYEIEELIPKEILDYWRNIEIYNDKSKQALFLIGYLMGEIGYAQSVKDIKNKPILNKINFQGMGEEKLVKLANDILEKLKQFDKLHYNEGIYSAVKLLMDNNIKKWNLSNQENVFYTLSGYAFLNYLIRKRSKESKESFYEELERKSVLIEQIKENGGNVEEDEIILYEAKNLAENRKYSEARKLLDRIKI